MSAARNTIFFRLTDTAPISDHQVSQLLDLCFSTPDYTSHFPTVYLRRDPHWSFGASIGDVLVGFCHIDILNWHCPTLGMIRIGCIGSVAVKTEVRQLNIASQLLILAEKSAQAACLNGLCLFSENRNLYQRLGYRRIGNEIFAPVSQFILPAEHEIHGSSEKYTLNTKPAQQLSLRERMSVWNLMQNAPEDSLLSYCDFERLMFIAPMQCITLQIQSSLGQHLVAAAFVGKGVDFQNVAHSICASNALWLNVFLHQLNLEPNSLHVLINGMHNPIEQHMKQAALYFKGNGNTPEHAACVEEHVSSGKIYVRALQST